MSRPSIIAPPLLIDAERHYAGERRSAVGEYRHHRYLWPVIEPLLPERPSHILDAGCGNGFLAARMARSGHQVTAVDLNAENIATARRIHPQVRFEAASVYDDLGEFRPHGGWDAIISVEVIAHLFSPQRFLANMRGNLAVGGRVIVTAPYHGYVKNLALALTGGFERHFAATTEGEHIKFFSPRTLAALFMDAGFEPPEFRYAGRVPMLWKSMVCHASLREPKQAR